MHVAAIIVAAGRGSRAGEGTPKQYRVLAGRPVLARTLAAFLEHRGIDRVLVVIHPNDEALYRSCITGLAPGAMGRLLPPAHGGETRQDSVMHGLEMLRQTSPAFVLVHDAARPFVDRGLIDRAIAAVQSFDAAVPGIPMTDTVKVVDDGGAAIETPDRRRLRAIPRPSGSSICSPPIARLPPPDYGRSRTMGLWSNGGDSLSRCSKAIRPISN